MHIRVYRPGDEQAIVTIYNHYIEHSTVTQELQPLTAAQMAERIGAQRQDYPWFVCEIDGRIVGYSYASAFHAREGYRHTAEPSIYVGHDVEADGVGSALYERLLHHLEHHTDCHAVVATIALPNDGSVALHESLGFRRVAQLPQVARKFDRWIDIEYWQKNFG